MGNQTMSAIAHPKQTASVRMQCQGCIAVYWFKRSRSSSISQFTMSHDVSGISNGPRIQTLIDRIIILNFCVRLETIQLAIPHLLHVVICQTPDPDEAREEREGRESSTQGTLGQQVVRTIGYIHAQRNIQCPATLFECILTHQRMLECFPTPATRAGTPNRMTGWGARATKLYDPLLSFHSNHV
jgi:hypothetical protein